jgi:ribosome-binding protein aMBF1 (putative translation factor)
MKKKSTTRETTSDGLEILDRLTGDDPELRELIAEERLNAQVARMIYDARTAAGLSQRELARLISTQQSTIARLEDADYEGHSLSMLRRIAEALNQRLEVRFVPRRAA